MCRWLPDYLVCDFYQLSMIIFLHWSDLINICLLLCCFTATLLQAMQFGVNISHQMEYLLATGNLVSRSGLGLMQVTDYYDFFVWLMKLLRTPHSPVLNAMTWQMPNILNDLYMHFFYLLLEANKYPRLNSGRAVVCVI